jgi:hypothetical protein
MLIAFDCFSAIVDAVLFLFHLLFFWRLPYLIFDIRKQHPHGSLFQILLLSVFQGIIDLLFLPFALAVIAHPLHTPIAFGAMIECCSKPRTVPFRIFVISEFFFALFELIFLAIVIPLSLHRVILLPVIYWQLYRSNFWLPGVARDGFHSCFWMLSEPCLQNIQNAWNDVFTLLVVVPCSVPMILAPWRLLRAASLCFVTKQERNAFYRTQLTAKVVYYMRILHDEMKELTRRACDDCKDGRFLWMQFRIGRFEELLTDTMAAGVCLCVCVCARL